MDPAKEQSAAQLARRFTATAGKRVNPIRELLPVEVGLKSLASPGNWGSSYLQLCVVLVQIFAKDCIQDLCM